MLHYYYKLLTKSIFTIRKHPHGIYLFGMQGSTKPIFFTGTPAHISFSGIFLFTKEQAPTTACSPIFIPFLPESIVVQHPMYASFLITIGVHF